MRVDGLFFGLGEMADAIASLHIGRGRLDDSTCRARAIAYIPLTT